MLKITICTIPIRPTPTDYPPFGAMAIYQSLHNAGFQPSFYDIDQWRPTFEEVMNKFKKELPDIICISAVVSTSYQYVKKLCLALRKSLPHVKIILGGNMAASAELLHHFCSVDVCVIGEGEKIIVNLLKHFQNHPSQFFDKEALSKIRGITYLDDENKLVFTGYETAMTVNEMLDPDFSILEKYSNIHNFISDPFKRSDFNQDTRSHESKRRFKKMATVVSSKGCVARCTFCHRWDKGYRRHSPNTVIRRIHYLMERYNVGFIAFGDENFGSDRTATLELLDLLKPLDILWQVAGVRANTVDQKLLRKMKESGCVAVYYGFESGSKEILQVMEKKLDLQHNFKAAQWTHEAGLFTIFQIVLGMPGENSKSIADTIEMLKTITEKLPLPAKRYLSVNYIQALPGTPVYEFARSKGFIPQTLEGEEGYLLDISGTESNDKKFINFTEHPMLSVKSWKTKLLYEVSTHWAKNHKKTDYGIESGPDDYFNLIQKNNTFNLYHFVLSHPKILTVTYPFRSIIIWGRTLISEFLDKPLLVFLKNVFYQIKWLFYKNRCGGRFVKEPSSLRKVMRVLAIQAKTKGGSGDFPLRLGR